MLYARSHPSVLIIYIVCAMLACILCCSLYYCFFDFVQVTHKGGSFLQSSTIYTLERIHAINRSRVWFFV